jgi:hypothetical protein
MAIQPTSLLIADIGPTDAFDVDLDGNVGEVPAAPRLSLAARILRRARLSVRSLPCPVGLAEACAGFRNIDRTPPCAATGRTP